jgi:hypothetical protein
MTVLGLACACSGTHEPLHDRVMPTAAKSVRHAAVLDVASLLPLSIDELGRRLGPRRALPPSFFDPTLVPLIQRGEHLDSMALFRCRGLALVASYDYNSRRVSDLLLLGSNENELMSQAQLQLGARQYLVLPVFQQHQPTQLLGLRVLPLAINQ